MGTVQFTSDKNAASKFDRPVFLSIYPPFLQHSKRSEKVPYLYRRSSAIPPVTSPRVATISARSGLRSAEKADHPANTVRCHGLVGECPPYSTRFAAGPDALCEASILLSFLAEWLKKLFLFCPWEIGGGSSGGCWFCCFSSSGRTRT